MLTKLKLERFKNFDQAELVLGPLTLLIGANAAGKSNLRDAFRFLHGLSRGYTLAEIMDEKYIEGRMLQWRGIRGGIREATYRQADTFRLTVTHSIPVRSSSRTRVTTYSIEVEPDSTSGSPRVVRESLYGASGAMYFDSHPSYPQDPLKQRDTQHLMVRIPPGGRYQRSNVESFIAHQPVLSQIKERINEQRRDGAVRRVINAVNRMIAALSSMRFLNLNLEAMRRPSLPKQTILGEQGENLASVLQDICDDPQRKQVLLEWIKELTPVDAQDFEFPADQSGRILLNMLEANGQTTSAYSASGGALRFLAMIAALLEPAQLYFFEELENGLHPARLQLLLQLIEPKLAEGKIQMVATSHSPQLLRFLSPTGLEHASLIYRLPDSPAGRIKRILDIPDVKRVIERHDLANLHESGWFEDVLYFDETEAVA